MGQHRGRDGVQVDRPEHHQRQSQHQHAHRGPDGADQGATVALGHGAPDPEQHDGNDWQPGPGVLSRLNAACAPVRFLTSNRARLKGSGRPAPAASATEQNEQGTRLTILGNGSRCPPPGAQAKRRSLALGQQQDAADCPPGGHDRHQQVGVDPAGQQQQSTERSSTCRARSRRASSGGQRSSAANPPKIRSTPVSTAACPAARRTLRGPRARRAGREPVPAPPPRPPRWPLPVPARKPGRGRMAERTAG